MLIDHTHDVERDEETDLPVSGASDMPDLQSLFRYTQTNYTPSISGAIDTVDFRIDYRTSDSFSDLSFFIQNGAGSGAISGFSTPNDDGSWHTLEVLGLKTSDFVNIDFEGSSPLSFGFGFYSSTFMDPGGTEPVTYQIEVDNFRVTVNPVPEPSSVAILFSGVALLAFRRKRSVIQ